MRFDIRFGLIALTLFLSIQGNGESSKCSALLLTDGQRGQQESRSSDLFLHNQDAVNKIEQFAVRQMNVAAHIYIESGERPYIFMATPTRNEGLAVFFDKAPEAHLKASSHPQLVRDGAFNGYEVQVSTQTQKLLVDDFILSSLRFIRDKELGQPRPSEIINQVATESDRITVVNTSLDGEVRFRLELIGVNGTKVIRDGSGPGFVSPTKIEFIFRALLDATPLKPLAMDKLFEKHFLNKLTQEELDAIAFLMYEEKQAAGSPRYLSDFFRDRAHVTTIWMKMGALKPEGVEYILSSMLNKAHPTTSQLLHEVHEGDFVSLMHLNPVEKHDLEDFHMIDNEFLFAVLWTEYATRFPRHAIQFLANRDQRGILYETLIRNNLNFIIEQTSAFTEQPHYKHLIGFHEGFSNGDMRDSEFGSPGKYPFSVNVALVPAALRGYAKLLRHREIPLFDPVKAKELDSSFAVWNSKALPLYMTKASAQTLEDYGRRLYQFLGVDPVLLPPAPQKDLIFPSISIDASGRRILIMHSDDSLMLAYGFPDFEYLSQAADRILMPFPYGLNAEVGLYVANPVVAPDFQSKFTFNDYWGLQSWKVQEDLLRFGLKRQLARTDLPPPLRTKLLLAEHALKKIIERKHDFGGQEVITPRPGPNGFTASPFSGDAKSNWIQLWSYLGVFLDR